VLDAFITLSLPFPQNDRMEVVSTQRAKHLGITYTLRNMAHHQPGGEPITLYFPVVTSSAGLKRKLVPGNNWFTGRFVKWPYPGLLLAVRGTAASSEKTWYYQVIGRKFVGPVACLDSGMNGGPLFRREGKVRTLVFDNYSYYLDRDTHRLPDRFLVYKVCQDGVLRFWKSRPNPDHIRLNDTTGL